MNDDKKIKIIIGILLALLAAFGVFLYFNSKSEWINSNNPSTYEYSNGDTSFLVTKVSDMNYRGSQIQFYLQNSAQPYILELRYGPLELEDVKIDRNVKQRFIDDESIFITLDPYANLTGKTVTAAMEITKVMNNQYFFHIPVNSSVTKPYNNYPVRTCENATAYSTVVLLRKGEENSISSDKNCVILTGITEEDLVKEADRLVLYLLGIMK